MQPRSVDHSSSQLEMRAAEPSAACKVRGHRAGRIFSLLPPRKADK